MTNIKGYSLVEIMIVLSLFAFLVLVATQILILSMRTTNKSQGVSRVKENLEATMSVMERQLRSAKSIIGCGQSGDKMIEYFDQDGNQTFFNCIPNGSDTFIASGSARLTNGDVAITSCSIVCTSQPVGPPTITISLEGEEDSAVSSVEKGKADLKTTIVLRSY